MTLIILYEILTREGDHLCGANKSWTHTGSRQRKSQLTNVPSKFSFVIDIYLKREPIHQRTLKKSALDEPMAEKNHLLYRIIVLSVMYSKLSGLKIFTAVLCTNMITLSGLYWYWPQKYCYGEKLRLGRYIIMLLHWCDIAPKKHVDPGTTKGRKLTIFFSF